MPDDTLKLMILTGSDRPEVISTISKLLPVIQSVDGVEVVGNYCRDDKIA